MEGTKRDLYEIFNGLVEKYKECASQVNECLGALDEEHIGKVNFDEEIRTIVQQMNTAKNKFTIATIGEFKAGKSTTINTLLNLRGDAGLSCQFQPDTAKAIRIMKKDKDQAYEAEIIYFEESGYANEKMSWVEAKRYTSQVALNENPALKKKAEQIDEVRYYVDLDLLDTCNFLDLPGTGFDPRHNHVTEAKINECDAVFWIMSNTEEANKETIKNLQMIKHKIIPIINVWYNAEIREETGDFSFEEMKSDLLDNFKAYLGENEIMKYCAKAIEIALEKIDEDEEEINEAFEDNENDTWGYNAMRERLHELVYGEGIDLEAEKKQRMSDNTLEACTEMNQKLDGIIAEVESVKNKLKIEERSNILTKQKISNAFNTNQLELKEVASNAVDTIITKITEACELFIDAKMSSPKLMVVMKGITENGRSKLEKEYQDEYIKKYLEIDNWQSGRTWLNAVMSEYKEDLTSIFDSEYSKAGLDLEEMEDSIGRDVNLDMNFFSAIGENMSIAFEQQIKENLSTIIAGILLYIPGKEIFDFLWLLASLANKQMNKNDNNKLEKRIEQTKRRARLSVSFQRLKLVDEFKKLGRTFNESYKKDLLDKLGVKQEKVDALVAATEKIFSIQEDLEEYYNACKADLKVALTE